MTAIFRLFVFLALWSTCAAQTYTLSSSTRFAARIHFSNPTNPQEPRVAGADHSVSEPMHEKVGLELTEDGGFVVIEGANYPLTKEDSHALRLGMKVKVAKDFRVLLSSNAEDRSKAILAVQSATSTDNALLEIVELRLVSPKPGKEAEQSGTGQPATRSQSKSEGGDKAQPESEGRSR